MAFARLLFRILLILLILLAVIGLMLPSSAKVERSIVINAAASEIFPHLNGMAAFHAWSPWSAIDPETQYRFDGPEQGIGSRMSWDSGHEQVGHGSQEVIDSVPNQRVEMQLEFGDKGNGSATFLLEPEGGSTRLRWQFRTDFGWHVLQVLARRTVDETQESKRSKIRAQLREQKRQEVLDLWQRRLRDRAFVKIFDA